MRLNEQEIRARLETAGLHVEIDHPVWWKVVATGPVEYMEDLARRVLPEGTDAETIRAELAAVQAERDAARAETERLRRAIEAVWRSVAGHAIRLREDGEDRAAEVWERHTQVLYEALYGKAARGGQ